jgi:hypothetical protein
VVLAMINSWLWKGCAPLIVLGVGVLAVGFFVVFNFEWLGDVITGRAALSGLLVSVMCLAAVVVWAVGVYFFAYKGKIVLPRSKTTIPLTACWDMTKSKNFTLNDASLQQLKELSEPLRIMVVGRLFNPYAEEPDPQAENLLAMYRQASSMVTVEYLRGDEESRAKAKVLAEKLHRDTPDFPFGTLALLYKDQVKSFQAQDLWEARPYMPMGNQVMRGQIFKGEEIITSAIRQMLDSKKPKVFFVWGHGERDPEGRDGRGLSFAQERLKGENMETDKLMLVSAEKVPEEADLLVICGPRQAFGPKELEVLKDYVVGHKGRLLICLDEYRPDADLGLDAFLAEFGILAGHDKIIEPDRHRHYPGTQYLIAVDYGNNPAVAKLHEDQLPVIFGPARSVRKLEEARSEWSVEPLVSGSESSYGETDLDAYYTKNQTSYQEGVDSPKPATYAVASWAGSAPPDFPGGHSANEGKLGRVVVFGDSSWCANQLFKAPAPFDNETLFTSTVKWLIGQETRIAIEPKPTEAEGFALLPVQQGLALYSAVTLGVLLLLVAGLTAWIRRR